MHPDPTKPPAAAASATPPSPKAGPSLGYRIEAAVLRGLRIGLICGSLALGAIPARMILASAAAALGIGQ